MLRVSNLLYPAIVLPWQYPYIALLMILTSAFEFSSRHGSKIKERPSDDEELSKVCIKYHKAPNFRGLKFLICAILS